MPDRDALVRTRPLTGIGFFGQAHDHVDHAPILRLERELLVRAARFPGLLAYHNVRFADGRWGNLVLFANAEGPSHVRADPTHLQALERTPSHYRSVRLHRLRLDGVALDDAPPALDSTLLIDFADASTWRAVRHRR